MSGVLAAIGSTVNYLTSSLEINQATLSGALDVIGVRYDDGSVKATPFHVRIGKIKLFRSKGKRLKVFVNGQDSGLVMSVRRDLRCLYVLQVKHQGLAYLLMQLGSAGEAYFGDVSRRDSVSSCGSNGSGIDLVNLPSLEVDGTVTLRGVAVGTLQSWGSAQAVHASKAASAAPTQSTLASNSPLCSDSSLGVGPAPSSPLTRASSSLAAGAHSPSPLREVGSKPTVLRTMTPLRADGRVSGPMVSASVSSPTPMTSSCAPSGPCTDDSLPALPAASMAALGSRSRATVRRTRRTQHSRRLAKGSVCVESETASESELLQRMPSRRLALSLRRVVPSSIASGVLHAMRSDTGVSDSALFSPRAGAHEPHAIGCDAAAPSDTIKAVSEEVDSRAIPAFTAYLSVQNANVCSSERVGSSAAEFLHHRHGFIDSQLRPGIRIHRRHSLESSRLDLLPAQCPAIQNQALVQLHAVAQSATAFLPKTENPSLASPVAPTQPVAMPSASPRSAPISLPPPISAATPVLGGKKSVPVPHRGRLGGFLNYLVPSRTYQQDDSDDSDDDVSASFSAHVAPALVKVDAVVATSQPTERTASALGDLSCGVTAALRPDRPCIIARSRSGDLAVFASAVIAAASGNRPRVVRDSIPTVVVPAWLAAWRVSRRLSLLAPLEGRSDVRCDPVMPIAAATATSSATPGATRTGGSYAWLRSFISRTAVAPAGISTSVTVVIDKANVVTTGAAHSLGPVSIDASDRSDAKPPADKSNTTRGLAGAVSRSNWFVSPRISPSADGPQAKSPRVLHFSSDLGRSRRRHSIAIPHSHVGLAGSRDSPFVDGASVAHVWDGPMSSTDIGGSHPRRRSVAVCESPAGSKDGSTRASRVTATGTNDNDKARELGCGEGATASTNPVPFSIDGWEAALHLVDARRSVFADTLASTLEQVSLRVLSSTLTRRRCRSLPLRTVHRGSRISADSLRAPLLLENISTTPRSTRGRKTRGSRRACSVVPSLLSPSPYRRNVCYQAFRLWTAAAAASVLGAPNTAPSAVIPPSVPAVLPPRGQRIFDWIPVVGSLLAPTTVVGAKKAAMAAPTVSQAIDSTPLTHRQLSSVRPVTSTVLSPGGRNEAVSSGVAPAISHSSVREGRRRASTASGVLGPHSAGLGIDDAGGEAGSVFSGDCEDEHGGYDTDGSATSVADGVPRRGVPRAHLSSNDEQVGARRALVPTDAQLRKLPLKLGPNQLEFVLEADATVRVSSTLYLWTPDVKIVVSDVDGTITKSDVLGHLAYMVGRDWTHAGVAQLFSSVRQNGYQVMYLTSRAIGQSDATKQYLTHITQSMSKVDPGDDLPSPSGPSQSAASNSALAARASKPPQPKGSSSAKPPSAAGPTLPPALTASLPTAARDVGPVFHLPAGPVFTSPDRLVTAFTREVIHRRPQEFKIPSLVSVLELFPTGSHPFFAGFGNRGTDVQAYQAVGIPNGKIFVINPQGEVRLASPMSAHASAVANASPKLAPSIAVPGSPARLSLAPDAQSSGARLTNGSTVAAVASQTYCKSYPAIASLVSEMFPYITERAAITAPQVGARYGLPVALDEHYGDVSYWRRPMAVLSESDIAAASLPTGTKPLVSSASAKLSTTHVHVGAKLAGASASGGGTSGNGTAGASANAARLLP